MPENSVCPQCHKPWHERPGWGCRLFAHITATHHPRSPDDTLEPPRTGWGILTPDEKLAPETIALVKALESLPLGQQHALLTRAVPRYLIVIAEVDVLAGAQPDESCMVNVTGNLSALWMDILGIP